MAEPSSETGGLLRWLQRSFIAGAAIALPLALTVWLIVTVVAVVDNNMLPLLPPAFRANAARVPGAGIMVAIVALAALGALAGNFLGRAIMAEVDNFVARLPFIRSIYGGAKQVMQHVATPEQRSFRDAVLLEFPQPGSWVVGFITNAAPDITPEGTVAVYVPHAPIPTSGFLIYAQRDKLRPLSVSAEEALKKVISLGAAQEAAPPSGV